MSTQQRNVLLVLIIVIVWGLISYLGLKSDVSDMILDNGESAGEQRMPEKFATAPAADDKAEASGSVTYVSKDATDEIIVYTTSGSESTGKITLKMASLSTRNWQVEGAELVFDMSSLPVKIESSAVEATFVITSVTPNVDESVIQGDMTMNGVTKTITFLARVGVTESQVMIKGQLPLDVALWDLTPMESTIGSMVGILLDIQLKKQ